MRATRRSRSAPSGSSERICHAVAEFSFRHAERTKAKVFGGPKYTVSPVYEGMLKEEMDAAAARHPEVVYEPQLIDATFALLIGSAGEALVIPALNRDGDILSDLVLPLFGSIAGSESLLVAFDDDYTPRALMAEAAHGTAPALAGKNVANPLAMILASAALLSHIDADDARAAGRAIREAALEAVSAGTGRPTSAATRRPRSSPTTSSRRVSLQTRSLGHLWRRLRRGLSLPPQPRPQAPSFGLDPERGWADERVRDGHRLPLRRHLPAQRARLLARDLRAHPGRLRRRGILYGAGDRRRRRQGRRPGRPSPARSAS